MCHVNKWFMIFKCSSCFVKYDRDVNGSRNIMIKNLKKRERLVLVRSDVSASLFRSSRMIC